MKEQTYQHLERDENGRYVRKPDSTLRAACEELAQHQGENWRVVHLNPNYGVIAKSHFTEITVWAR